jgi:mannose-6-phosphate isomerase
MHRLSNPWMRYAWGSVDLLPALMGMHPDGLPLAEIWMGAHAAAPSSVAIDGHDVGLDDLIARSPHQALGSAVVQESGARLPFMMKLLAADKPLSLQVHPTREQAEEGYRREDEAGIPLTDPSRNYRDSAHKPELLFALAPFEMLCGFRPIEAIRDVLEGLQVAELDPLLEGLDCADPEKAVRSALTAILTAEPWHRQSVTQAVVRSARTRSEQRAEYPLVCDLARHYPTDVGIVAALFLNHLRVRPGAAVFIGAGMVHAYLRGLAVELMATSDNVLRAGLTAKHVDVQELLRLVDFAPGEPEALSPARSGAAAIFTPPVRDFALWTYAPGPTADRGADVTVDGPSSGARIAVCCEGQCTLIRQTERLELRPGQAAFIPHADGPLMITAAGTAAVACSRSSLSEISRGGDDFHEGSVEVPRQVERVQGGQ